jgi:hypothetical protein
MTDTLAVTLLTAHRLEYAVTTARALARNLHHDGPVHWHIADDGDDDNYIGAIADAICEGAAVGWQRWSLTLERSEHAPAMHVARRDITTSNAVGRGYGASYNLAMQTTHHVADYHLVVEDDWELRRPLDTAPIIKMLERKGHQTREEWPWAVEAPAGFDARSVRLGYLGYQWPVTMHLFKTDEHLWAALDPDSPEQHIAAGHPRIETTEYQRAVGPWPEGLNPGATELGWCQTAEARRGVVWPLTIVSLTGSISGDLFAHIGSERSYNP